MIRTLPTDLTTSWTSVQTSTTNRTPVVNSDGTFDCGFNYYNLIHEIARGNEYSFIIDFNITVRSFYFAFIRFNNDAIQNLVSFSNTKVSDPSDLTAGNNRLVLTVASDGKVTAYFKTDSYEIGTIYSGNPYSLDAMNYNTANTLTVNSIRVCDSVLSSTEINTILGNGGGAITNKYSIIRDENTDTGFSTDNWTGNGTRTIQENGTLQLTYGTGVTHNYSVLPSGNWKLQIDMSIDTTAQSAITYGNNVDGALYLALYSDKTVKMRETTATGGVHTVSKSTDTDKFITNSNTRNTLTIERNGTSITFRYKSLDTNNVVEYTRTYPQLQHNGFLQIQTWNGAVYTVYSIAILQELED